MLSLLLVLCASITFYIALINFPSVWKATQRVAHAASPIFWGAFLAYLLNPLCELLEEKAFKFIKNKHVAHVLSVVVSMLLVFTFIIFIILKLIPQLIDSVTALASNWEGYGNSIQNILTDIQASIPSVNLNTEALMQSWNGSMKTLLGYAVSNLESVMGGVVQIGVGAFNTVIVIILTIYILLDKSRIILAFKRICLFALRVKKYKVFYPNLVKAHNIFKRYFIANLIDALIIGCVNFVFMLIMGMPYAILISVIAGVTNLVPNFGPVFGAIPNCILLLIIDPLSMIWFLIWTLVLQTIDGYVLKPLLFGDSTGLRPLYVICATILGGRLFGIWGMLLGTPVVGLISCLVTECLAKNNLDITGDK